MQELWDLYHKVKLAIIYSENFNPDRFPLAPMNELRGVIDHIFKASQLEKPEDIDNEIKKIKEHLDRAGYDAFELLASRIGLYLIETLEPYDNDSLTNVFPEYYTSIKPQLTNIKENLTQIRGNKKDSVADFGKYYNWIKVLLEFKEKVDMSVPSLEEYKRKKTEEGQKIRKKNLINQIIIGVIAATVGGIIVLLLEKFCD